ncbi:MAG: sulfur carrier protein ThiS [Candidatus Margulisbacteria bacterium]|nr:sulfur carrier protein ThiS [Candidatus Margulisiibacteriota bacterium]
MEVVINGKTEEIEPVSVGDLLRSKDVKFEVVTVELNDEIIKRGSYDSTSLKKGDRVEFVYYMGGG